MKSYRMFARVGPAQAGTIAPDSKQWATHNDLDHPTAERSDTHFYELRDRLALKGWHLLRSDRHDGPVHYWIESYVLTQRCESLDAVQKLIEATEGQHGT